MILLLAFLRRLPILLGLLFLLTVLPALLVLGTQWSDWPELTWPPLHTGFLGEFESAHFRAWTVDSYHEIRLTLGVDGFVVGGCLLFMWALWGVTICWITEDTYLLLRYGTRQLREHGPDGTRGWITALVTGTVLLGTATPSLASALPSNPVAANAPRHPGGPQHNPEVPSAAPETDGHHAPGPSVSGPAGPAVFVHRGDSLWLLAQIHLGDGNRWTEITHLNPYLSPEPRYLPAGQWLRMPDDAVRTEPPPLPDDVRWVTVGNDDTLTGLAQHHLGDPDRWQEIFDLYQGRTQASNRTLRYPHVLMPGWRLALPLTNTTHPATQPPKPPAGENEPIQPRPGPAPKAPVTPPSQPDRTPPARSPSGPPSPGVIAVLSTAGLVGAAVVMRYRFRLRHIPKTAGSPLPTVYPLPVAVHRTRLEPDTSSDDDLADEYPGEAAGPSVSAHRGDDSRAQETTRTARPPALMTVSPSPGPDEHEAEPESPPSTTPAAPRAPHAEPEAPAEQSARLRVTVFGQPRLHWHQPGQQSGPREVGLQPRMRDVLVYLALNPGGAGRDEILEALWGEAVPGSNALNTTLSRLRRILTRLDHDLGELVHARHGHYRLNTILATTDYHDFTTAVTTRRTATTDTQRAEAHETIIAVYQGDLADGIDTTWIEPVREHARRTYLDTITAHTRALAPRDPHRALGILEHARDLAPFHEPLYRDIMRLQHTLDHTDDIARTLTLLHSTLADIDTTPHPDTLLLAEQLQHPHNR
ncbi:BTAD domain-containing putative transcriptional regulator [Saccharopolyspora sp. 6V]|uniref:AfsR/SARP family transcriptional regulator n=1 Tax=Saccharopolyspora sp. 6V TaxID=2877239 RepID=UPI001CD433EA|nr:winged helix-turn-helix domain-containing protein [Saccharopolyspora sp. 6V]MCA1192876.1 winged helix-turn-helix domain-containing protein [Saccharopolyspora sp. 6V]